MKAQEIFDTVVVHLLEQGEKSISSKLGYSSCRYRGPNGLRCAVGCVIPDDIWEPAMEGWRVNKLFQEYPNIRKLLGFRNLSLLLDCQNIHDNTAVREWREKLKKLGRKRRLSIKVLEAA